MPWQTPKTDWTGSDAPTPGALNRIEGNILELKKAATIDIVDAGSNFQATNVEDALQELAGNVVAGKSAIASAIYSMGQQADGSMTFAELAAKIQNISKDATAASNDVLSGRTFYQGGLKRTGTMPNRGAVVITPGATAKFIPAGYHNGEGYVATDPDLVPENIVQGKNIFGVEGSAITSNLVKYSRYTYPGSSLFDGVSYSGNAIFMSPQGNYCVLGSNVDMYKRNPDDTWSKVFTSNEYLIRSGSWTPDENYLLAGVYDSNSVNGIVLFKRMGDTLLEVARITASSAVDDISRWDSIGTYCVAYRNNTVALIQRTGDSISIPSSASGTSKTNLIYRIQASSDLTRIIVQGSQSSSGVSHYLYQRSGTTITRVHRLDLDENVRCFWMTEDGQFLMGTGIPTSTHQTLGVWEWSGTTYVKRTFSSWHRPATAGAPYNYTIFGPADSDVGLMVYDNDLPHAMICGIDRETKGFRILTDHGHYEYEWGVPRISSLRYAAGMAISNNGRFLAVLVRKTSSYALYFVKVRDA